MYCCGNLSFFSQRLDKEVKPDMMITLMYRLPKIFVFLRIMTFRVSSFGLEGNCGYFWCDVIMIVCLML